jgi:hypothetical protein
LILCILPSKICVPTLNWKNSSDFSVLSVNNPISDEVEVLLNNENENEADKQLYGVQDDTVVTLSSINEFDKKKDWLTRQLVCDTSSSEEE